MDRSPLRHPLRAVAAGVLVAAAVVPLAAQGVELAELSWNGKFGSGYIVYDRDALDAVDADGRGSFLGAIRSFDFGAIRLPYGTASIELSGNSGSILSLNKAEDWSSVSFLLGAAHAGDPLSYKLTLRLPFLLDDHDLIPLGRADEGWLLPAEPDGITGVVSNEFNSPSGAYIAVGWGSMFHRLLPAPPVPEPATLAMFGLGAGMLLWGRRRKG